MVARSVSANSNHGKKIRKNGAGDGNRTHVASLEGWNFTIKLHPHKPSEIHHNSHASLVNVDASSGKNSKKICLNSSCL
jgi:hypothetical protein